MSISKIAKEYGPKTALAVAEVTGAEELAADRLLDQLCSADCPPPAADCDAERWDGLS